MGLIENLTKGLLKASKRYRKENLVNIFYAMMDILEFRGYPEIIIQKLRNQFNEVISMAYKIPLPYETYDIAPFLPVVQKSYMGVYGLMSMLRHDKSIGRTNVAPFCVYDAEEGPKEREPYFIYSIQNIGIDGMLFNVREAASKQRRRCLTFEECLSMCLFYPPDHKVCCAGSNYINYDSVLCIDGAELYPINYPVNCGDIDNLAFPSCL